MQRDSLVARSENPGEGSQPPRILHPLDRRQNQSDSWKRPEKIRLTILPTESWARRGWNISGQDWGYRDSKMFVVRSARADVSTPLHRMPSMEKREEEINQRTEKTKHYLASQAGQEVSSKLASKQASCRSTVEIFEKYRGRE